MQQKKNPPYITISDVHSDVIITLTFILCEEGGLTSL